MARAEKLRWRVYVCCCGAFSVCVAIVCGSVGTGGCWGMAMAVEGGDSVGACTASGGVGTFVGASSVAGGGGVSFLGVIGGDDGVFLL